MQNNEPSKKFRLRLGSWQYWVGILGLLFTVATVVAVVVYWNYVRALGAYGYVGAFVISVFGGATVIAPIPMTPVIFALGSVLRPWYVGLAAGAGETIGGLAIYMTGYGGGTAFTKAKSGGKIQRAYERMTRWVDKSGALGIFILSATINPLFYPAALAAGALRFSLWKFTIICLAGKIIKGLAVAFAGYYGLRQLMHFLGIQM